MDNDSGITNYFCYDCSPMTTPSRTKTTSVCHVYSACICTLMSELLCSMTLGEELLESDNNTRSLTITLANRNERDTATRYFQSPFCT